MFDIGFHDLLAAFALVFVFEGMLLFINPEVIRKLSFIASQMNNQALRFIGLTSMLFGIIFLYIVR